MILAHHNLAIVLSAAILCAGCNDKENAATAPQTTVTIPADLGTNALERVRRLCELGPRDALTPGAEAAAKWLGVVFIGIVPAIVIAAGIYVYVRRRNR